MYVYLLDNTRCSISDCIGINRNSQFVIVAFLFAISLWFLFSYHKGTCSTQSNPSVVCLTTGTCSSASGGTFENATAGTFVSAMPGTFVSATGGTFNPLLSVFLSEDCAGFKVSTPNYNGTVIITFQDNSFYSVSFRDLEFKIMGITGAEKVLDAVKDFVENGEVWV